MVLTSQPDTTADLVVRKLNERDVPVFRFDTTAFPTEATMAAQLGGGWGGGMRLGERELELDRVGSAYYRRPGEFAMPASISPAARRFAAAQSRAGLLGVLVSLDCLWVNHPGRNADASYKPWQLTVAEHVGLRPPRTLITNDPDAARRFAKDIDGPVIYKTLAGGVVDDDGVPKGMPTSVVDPDGLDDSIALCAHQFQEWVDKQHEVRLTVVGDEFFAAEIHAGSDDAHVDWRNDYASLSYEIADVPDDVRRGVVELMRSFGLVFGALDFVVTPAGEWRFLEINPNGQWGWIETVTGLPIATALAELLQRGTTT
ncbi:ATP-grasp ribosomal peptide maturase [Jiangella endophytica]|uniref:ATP-grasp ribosomal peptide maturase n=1 Tax=Jiangella endophytica TaxID=1623398 RepID=UPI000E355E6D|nr:ATP-grasp ribosomal peptide maturase [Jiangella endophytica]